MPGALECELARRASDQRTERTEKLDPKRRATPDEDPQSQAVAQMCHDEWDTGGSVQT